MRAAGRKMPSGRREIRRIALARGVNVKGVRPGGQIVHHDLHEHAVGRLTQRGLGDRLAVGHLQICPSHGAGLGRPGHGKHEGHKTQRN